MTRFVLALLPAIVVANAVQANAAYEGITNVTVDLSVLGNDEEFIIHKDFYDENFPVIINAPCSATQAAAAKAATSEASATKQVAKIALKEPKNTKTNASIILKKPDSKKITLKKPGKNSDKKRSSDNLSQSVITPKEPKATISSQVVLIPPESKRSTASDTDTLKTEPEDLTDFAEYNENKNEKNKRSVYTMDPDHLLARGPIKSINNRIMFDFNVGSVTSEESDSATYHRQQPAIAKETEVTDKSLKSDALTPKAAKTEKVMVDEIDNNISPDAIINQRIRSNVYENKQAINNIIANNNGNILVMDFAEGSDQVNDTYSNGLAALSRALKDAPSSRVRLISYAKDDQNYSSKARRLSLDRATKVRDVLINSGANSEQIEVRALGNRVSKDVIFLEIITQ